MSSVKSPIIVALDYPHADAALTLVDQLDPLLCRVKVGKELFTREGPAIIKAIQSRGFELFLDLKLSKMYLILFRKREAYKDIDQFKIYLE